MENLPSVQNDLLNTRTTIEMMGIPEYNIFEFLDSSHREVKEFEDKFKRRIIAHTTTLQDRTGIGGDLSDFLWLGGISWKRLKKFATIPGYSTDRLCVSPLNLVLC